MMTDNQKSQIMAMREQKLTYARISSILGIPEGTIKNYCFRHGMTTTRPQKEPCCKNCGGKLTNTPKAKPRLFCSDRCKQIWWNKSRTERISAKIVPHICLTCGTIFMDYGVANRKYCSQKCYRERL